MLHVKTFLDPKLLDKLSFSSQVYTGITNKPLETELFVKEKAAPKARRGSVIAANKLRSYSSNKISRTKEILLRRITNEPLVLNLIQLFLGNSIQLVEVIFVTKKEVIEKSIDIAPSPPPTPIVIAPPPPKMTPKIDIQAYRTEHAQLIHANKELKATEAELLKELTRCRSFVANSSFNVDHTRITYLITKVSLARTAGFPGKTKSAQNEYANKLADIRKNVKVFLQKRLDEVKEDIVFLETLHANTLQSSMDFIRDVSEAEKTCWKQLTSPKTVVTVTDSDLNIIDPNSQYGYGIPDAVLLEDRIKRATDEARHHLQSVLAYMDHLENPNAPRSPKAGGASGVQSPAGRKSPTRRVSILGGAGRQGTSSPVHTHPGPPPPPPSPHISSEDHILPPSLSGLDSSRSSSPARRTSIHAHTFASAQNEAAAAAALDTSYHHLYTTRIREDTEPRLHSFNNELIHSMHTCLQMATDSVSKKHGSIALHANNLTMNDTLTRLEHLQLMSESFRNQQEKIRERLYEVHEDTVTRAAHDLLERRLTFLSRLKEKFEHVQRTSKDVKNEHKRLVKKSLSSNRIV